MTKSDRLRRLESECHKCVRCGIGGKVLFGGHLSNVFSNMCMKARIMVVGQNPGRVEVERGRPFVGESGRFFDGVVLDVLGVDRSTFYICNAVRCHTPGNRPPTASEIENCRSFLDEEIAIVEPELVVTLGGFGLKQVTGLSGIRKRHGEKIISLRYKVPVIPLLHPSPLNMNKKENREIFREDVAALREYL